MSKQALLYACGIYGLALVWIGAGFLVALGVFMMLLAHAMAKH